MRDGCRKASQGMTVHCSRLATAPFICWFCLFGVFYYFILVWVCVVCLVLGFFHPVNVPFTHYVSGGAYKSQW